MAQAIPVAHWSQLIENLQTNPQDFYRSVEESVERRHLPDSKRSRVQWREGGLMSAKREYLRLKRKEELFDICGAPFGTGFFVSWWQAENGSTFRALMLSLPIVGGIWAALFPDTYYKIDTEEMFGTSVHSAVMDVIDGMTQQQGLRQLTELERKPVMREFFQKTKM